MKRKLYRYSDGCTYTDNLTLKEANAFRKMQNGGRITPMSMVPFFERLRKEEVNREPNR